MDDNSLDRHAVPLAAVRLGMLVIDLRGAFLGRVKYVGTGDPSAGSTCGEAFVKVQGCPPRDRTLLIAAGRIAYVADDHVRLSVTADEVFGDPQAPAGP